MGGTRGYYFRGGVDIRVEHASAINYSLTGYRFDLSPQNVGLASSVRISTALAVTSTGSLGFVVKDQQTWSIDDANAHGNQTANYQTSGAVGGSYAPKLGGCLVYVPAGTPGKGAAADGSDVGATVIFRSQDGKLTNTRLWDAKTGGFPCGATVAGLNDGASTSTTACVNAHNRLHVGTSGCPIP